MKVVTATMTATAAITMSILAAPSAAGGALDHQTVTLCRPYQVSVINGYVARNDVFRPSPQSPPAQECITSTIAYPSFRITKITARSRQSVAYPSIYYGCQYGRCSQKSALPAVVRNVPHLTLSACYDFPPAGKWNVGTDMWFTRARQVTGHPLGAEMMLWFATRGFGPRRGHRVTIDHARWLVYEWITNSGGATIHKWPLIIFRKVTPIRSRGCAWRLPLSPFFRYAETRRWMTRTMWLESLNVGFELWDYALSDGKMKLTWLRIWPRGTTRPPATQPAGGN
jgi:hypothetical protein